MATKKHTISVRLEPEAKRRVEQAARLMKQSCSAFLEKAGEEQARQILRQWAVSRYREGAASFSEVAQETGLAVEEIMEALGGRGQEEALAMFLAACQTVAEAQGDPEFLHLGQEAVHMVDRSRSRG